MGCTGGALGSSGGRLGRGKRRWGKCGQEARQHHGLTGAAPDRPASTQRQQCPWLTWWDEGLLQQPPVSASSLQKGQWEVILFHIGLHWIGAFFPSFFSLRAHPVHAAPSGTWQWAAGSSLGRGGCSSASPQKPACSEPAGLSPLPSVLASQRQNSHPQGPCTNL